jgi:hypothetical protein
VLHGCLIGVLLAALLVGVGLCTVWVGWQASSGLEPAGGLIGYRSLHER